MKDKDEPLAIVLPIDDTLVLPDVITTDLVALMVADLTLALEKLTETLSLSLSESGSLTLTHAFFAIFVVVIGAFSAYGFNFLHWRMVDRRQNIKGTRLALSDLVNDLESVAVNYWLRDYCENDRLEIQAAEITIKTKIPLISKYSRLVASQLSSNLLHSEKQKFDEFPLEIFDLATGDGFESISKKSSKSKAMKISKLCLDIKATILTLNNNT